MAAIKVSFQPPSIPNGRISRYLVYYNKTINGADYHKEIRIQDGHDILKGVVLDNVFFYTNYSVQVSGCVEQACSKLSDPVYVSTAISRPGPMSPPRVEMFDTFLNVSWEPPLLPNGPLNYYQLHVEDNGTNIENVYNVTGKNFWLFEKQCSVVDKNETLFQIRAINMNEGVPLFGEYSRSAKTVVCPAVFQAWYYIGIIVGVTTGFLIMVAIFYASYRCYIKVRLVKRTTILLPEALEDSNSATYDKFKSGLRNNHDSGIPNDRAYDRLVTGGGGDDYMDAEATDHNETGINNQCHDSISSAKTQNSMDSGAEIESPPSPDSFSSDSGSINTTNRSFKPDTEALNALNRFISKDSGLGKDGVPLAIHAPPKSWSIKVKALQKCLKNNFDNKDLNLIQMDKLSLSNSEPSMVDFEHSNGSEYLVNGDATITPYAKFGITRSQSNVTIPKDCDKYKPSFKAFSALINNAEHVPIFNKIKGVPNNKASEKKEDDSRSKNYSVVGEQSSRDHSPESDHLKEQNKNKEGGSVDSAKEKNDAVAKIESCKKDEADQSNSTLPVMRLELKDFDITKYFPDGLDPELGKSLADTCSRLENGMLSDVGGRLLCGGGLIDSYIPFEENEVTNGPDTPEPENGPVTQGSGQATIPVPEQKDSHYTHPDIAKRMAETRNGVPVHGV